VRGRVKTYPTKIPASRAGAEELQIVVEYVFAPKRGVPRFAPAWRFAARCVVTCVTVLPLPVST
jgi:hypothetical protein